MLRVASDQPTFLPWAGFWNKALCVDLLIFNVAVPVSYGAKDHYHNRVKMAGSWLTVPVTSSRLGPFMDMDFDRAALPKLAKSIRNTYGRRFPFHDRAWEIAERIETYVGPDRLYLLNMELLEAQAREMSTSVMGWRIDTTIPDQQASKTERLISRIRRFTDEPVAYYLGRGALRYLDPHQMAGAGITCFVQTYAGGMEDETALTLIAQERDPAEVMRGLASWEPWQ